MNCANCGKEIQDEKSSFCAYCGTPLNSKPKKELTTAAGTLTLIAASLSAAVGTIGAVSYPAYLALCEYYAAYPTSGYTTDKAIGFLLLGAFAFIAAAFGFAAGILTLTRKRLKLSVIGPILMVASTIFTLVTGLYNYGYTEGILLATIPTGALSIISIIFIIKSKTEFTTTPKPTEAELEENTESDPETELDAELETEDQE